ncbi:hypothetical protein ACFSB1_00410 [Halopseudomonas phragmitis]|uniref:Uncharacterized protein n=1 Tax=Halopseudomonas phragmitis TaxID=1931241 RepID=A0A1V0B693_9GAMM|nr:hypothetical protein [Halopseudomonas phragmitis]AQZ95448.1 hypothetical protein BVH74_12115 [Halopseudomonas phragmitis]
MSRITKEQAIAAVGEEVINTLLFANVEPTNRVTNNGTAELSARIKAMEGEDQVTVFMYVYVDEEEFMNAEDLGTLDWDDAMANAEFEIY